MVKCRFCEKEIGDADTVCKHCGRVLGTPKTVRTGNSRAAVRPQGAAWAAVPVKVIPDSMPEKKGSFMPELVSELSGKIIGLSLLGGIYAFVSFVAELVQRNRINWDALHVGIGLFFAYFLLVQIRAIVVFLKAKKFIRKNGYERAICNDTPAIDNAIAAYRLAPSFWMVRYIKKHNAGTGEIIGSVLKKTRKANIKRRLGYIPWLLLLAAGFGSLGYLDMNGIMVRTAMFVLMHILAFLVNMIYSKVKGQDKGLKTYTVILFFFALMACADIDYGYHVLICIGAVLLGGKLGEKIHK